ncbi:MAG: alpha/beta hydrolase [Planctomycetota bacterium]|jgi:esterase/lipase superfamily enzyme
MPSPNIWVFTQDDPWADLPPELQTTTVDLLYVTDREPVESSDNSTRYGYGRSWSVAFGSVEVELGRDATWDELVAASRTNKRKGTWPVTVESVTETVRFPRSPFPLIERDGEIITDPDIEEISRRRFDLFGDEIRRRLALTSDKSVGVLVHGFANTFDDGAKTLAEYWHMTGRQGVPLLYSWPAGAPGMLRGYTRDRESGQFTVYHLRRLIETLADIPEVEHIELIAHSRGTDVLSSAMKGLAMMSQAAGRDPHEDYRIREVVLASPDLDFDVLAQRFAADRVFSIAERTTIYVTKDDQAISVAEWLHASKRRLGRIRPEDIDPYTRAILAIRSEDVAIVDARVKTGSFGHAYYHSSPAVSSDMLLFLMGVEAGTPERPLVEVFPGYWLLDDENYPFIDSPADQPAD